MGAHSGKPVDFVRKTIIIVCLFVGLLALYRYAETNTPPQAASLMALGFVVLAAFLIGEVVEVIKLPHITGYLLAGLCLGESIPKMLQKNYHLIPPFDSGGILNYEVIASLGPLDTLALPLICLTAGGALKPKEISRAIRPISGVLIGQIITMFIGIVTLFWLFSGPVSFLVLPGLDEQNIAAILAIGGVVASISLATSDAATIAIVVSSKAKGPMTTNVVSVAVIKDVVVVIAFSATMTLAMTSMGTSGGAGLGMVIILIGCSAVLGVVLGWLLHLYLKHVGVEVLLFLTATIFTVSYLSNKGELLFELGKGMGSALSAVTFIAAGFVAANFSEKGDELIAKVEKLSTPVFVVFFTLAGARLHLDQLVDMAKFGMLLVAVRALAFYIGVRAGATLFNADEGTRRYGWMGFVSQAGLAITLAQLTQKTLESGGFNDLAASVVALIFAGVAINEIIGPAMLQASLSFAGELPKNDDASSDSLAQPDRKPASTSNKEWNAFPPSNPELQNVFADTQGLLQNIFDDIVQHSLAPRKEIFSQIIKESKECKTKAEKLEFCRQKALFLAKGTTISFWNTSSTLKQLDALAKELTDGVWLPFEDATLTPSEADSRLISWQKSFARFRSRFFPLRRFVNIREVANYHFSGHLYNELIGFAESLIAVERDFAQKLQNFAEEPFEDLESIGQRFEDVEQDLMSILSHQHNCFCRDLIHISTFMLSAWSRRLGRVFAEKNRGLSVLLQSKGFLEDVVSARWQGLSADFAVRIFATDAIIASHKEIDVYKDLIQKYFDKLALLQERSGTWGKEISVAIDEQKMQVVKQQTDDVIYLVQGIEIQGEGLIKILSSESVRLQLIHRLSLLVSNFPRNIKTISDSESILWDEIQHCKVEKVAIKNYITGFIETNLSTKLQQTLLHFIESISFSCQLLVELQRSLQYNLSAVLAEVKDQQNDEILKEMLIRSAERVVHRLGRRLNQESEQFEHRMVAQVDDIVNNAIQEFSTRLLSEQRMVMEEEQSLPEKPSWFSRVKEYVRDVARLIRRVQMVQQEETVQANFDVPYKDKDFDNEVYIRLFNPYRGDAQSLPERRIKLSESIIKNALNGESVALVGTFPEVVSLAESIVQNWKGDAITYRPRKMMNVDELKKLESENHGKLIVINGVRWLFHTHQQSSLENMLWLQQQLASGSKTKWLFLADTHVWKTLNLLSPLENFLSEVYTLSSLNKVEMKQAVLSRHQMSGYDIKYPESDQLTAKIWKVLGQYNNEENWFISIYERCHGELDEAFSIWLSSIRQFDEQTDSITFYDYKSTLYESLSLLSLDELLLLRQIIRQGWADIGLVCNWFGESKNNAYSKLFQLQSKGVIKRNEDVWMLHSHLRFAAESVLKDKGWL